MENCILSLRIPLFVALTCLSDQSGSSLEGGLKAIPVRVNPSRIFCKIRLLVNVLNFIIRKIFLIRLRIFYLTFISTLHLYTVFPNWQQHSQRYNLGWDLFRL